MQILCGLQVVFFLFNCQTPVYLLYAVSSKIKNDFIKGSPFEGCLFA